MSSLSAEADDDADETLYPAHNEDTMSSKKHRRIKREEVPMAFDLDLVTYDNVIYLPDGLERALVDAGRNRHHTLKGIAWSMGGGINVRPNDWILLRIPGVKDPDWWLVYSTDQTRMIVTSQGGGYWAMNRSRFLLLILDVKLTPPWHTEVAEG